MVTSRTFRALRQRNYRYFFIGQTISLTGSWVQSTAQAWLILQLTHSTFALGALLTVQFLPNLLVQPFGGVLADRWSKRRTLIATQSCYAATAALLAVLVALDVAANWQVFCIVGAFGLISVVDGPARQAFIPEMVGRGDVANAVALNSMVLSGTRVIGPAIGGLMIATVGTGVCFVVNAASYIAVIGGLWLMRPHELHSERRAKAGSPGVTAQIKEGIRHARRTPQVALVMVLMAWVGTLSYNMTLMLVSLSRSELHLGAGGFGLLSAALGVGALLGAAGVASLLRVSIPLLLCGCCTLGGFIALAGAVPSLGPDMVVIAVAGAGMTVYSAVSNSVIQTYTPAPLLGRVSALFLWVFMGTAPIGSLLFGSIEQGLGSRVAMAIAGGAAALGAGAAWIWWVRIGRTRDPAGVWKPSPVP